MNFKDKILLISFFVIFISIIASLIFRNISFLLFGIIIIIFLFYVYLFNNEMKIKTRENLDVENLDFLENKLCVKPTKDNPFMNPNILEKSNLTYKSCNIQNNKIKTNMNNILKNLFLKMLLIFMIENFQKDNFIQYLLPVFQMIKKVFLNGYMEEEKLVKKIMVRDVIII